MDTMHSVGAIAFLQALGESGRHALQTFAAQAVQPPAVALQAWYCADVPLGLLQPARAEWLVQQLPGCAKVDAALVWQAGHWSPAQRSAVLQQVLREARAQGLLTGWRDEAFSFWAPDAGAPDPQCPALLQVERAGFRFLGMQSHAVHVNGFMPDGRLWCGQRARSKATDPGLLDNLAAGGLPAGEAVLTCLQRELAEEAGLFSLQGLAVQACGSVRTARLEPQGWHDEILHVYNLELDSGFVPHNQDGEVAAFHCLRPTEVLQRMQQGVFTVDAVQTLLQGLRPLLAG